MSCTKEEKGAKQRKATTKQKLTNDDQESRQLSSKVVGAGEAGQEEGGSVSVGSGRVWLVHNGAGARAGGGGRGDREQGSLAVQQAGGGAQGGSEGAQ